MRSWTIRVPFAGEWLTANRSSRYRWHAPAWREAVMVACRQAKLPTGVTPVTIHAVCHYAGRPPVRDAENLAPTMKAMVDGLTPTRLFIRLGRPHQRGGYGLIPDDSDRHVLRRTWDLAPTTGQPHVLLTITEAKS